MSVDSKSKIDKFGVELEMVLAFHEDRLIPILESRGLTKRHIVKNLSDRNRAFIGIKAPPRFGNPRSRPSHRGWALRIDPNDSNDWRESGTHPQQDYRAGYTRKYRTYWAEPLQIVRAILQEHQLNADVELSAHPLDPTYKDWTVSNDCSLVPLSQEQKLDRFHDRMSAARADDWDTTGIEVVTPPMRPDNPISFQEIDRYLKALQGTSGSTYGVTTSKYAGLHVHVGFNQTIPAMDLLHTMQHLAYMLVQFEPLLVRLFPPYRDGGRQGSIICENDARSNLAGIIRWETETYHKRPSLQDIANTIFMTPSIPALRMRMHHDRQHKGYQVNFLNIALASFQPWNKKRTVEFRLHESTLQAQEIEMWVRFCVAFCRAAERQAARLVDRNGEKITEPYSPTTEYGKYKKRNLDDEVTTTDLFRLLDLDDDLQKYWQARWDTYHDEQHMEQPTPEIDPPLHSSESEDNDDDDDDDDDDNDRGPKSRGDRKKPGRSPRNPAGPKGKGKSQHNGFSSRGGKPRASGKNRSIPTRAPGFKHQSPKATTGKRKRNDAPATCLEATPNLRRSARLQNETMI